MWKKCIRLPGCNAVTAPSTLPPLNQDRQEPAQAVRGMKVVMCSKKSSTADWDGAMDLMPSVWHLRIAPVMYLAMCSVKVKTLPWPIGAFGPKNAAVIVSGPSAKGIAARLREAG